MSQPPPQPQLQVHDDGSYSDSGTSLGFGSDAEDWTDIDVSSSGRGSDESASESGDDDQIAEYNLSQSAEWQAIVAATPALAAALPLDVASAVNLGTLAATPTDHVPLPLGDTPIVPGRNQQVATSSAISALESSRQPSFDLQFPDPLDSSLEVDNLLHERKRSSSTLRCPSEDRSVQRPPPGSLADSILTEVDPSEQTISSPKEMIAPPLPKSRAKLQVTYLGYAPALYKRETVTQALVAMAGPDIDIVFVENADLSSSVHSSYSSPFNPSVPTLALVFLNPPLPMPAIPTTITNIRFLPVLMPTLNSSSSGSNSLLSLSMSSLFDFTPSPTADRSGQLILGRDRAEVAEEEWAALGIPSSSVLATGWKKTVVELAEVESEEPVLASALRGAAFKSYEFKDNEDDHRSSWVGPLTIALVALLLGSSILSAGAPLNSSPSSPSPFEPPPIATQTPFWQSAIFTSLGGIFNSSSPSPSSPHSAIPSSTGLAPIVHKGYSLSVFSTSDPLKQMLSATGRGKNRPSGHHCEHEGANKDHLSWAAKVASHVPSSHESGHHHPPVFPIIQIEDDEGYSASPETSLGRVLVSSMRVSYDTISKIIVKDLKELMEALEELFGVLKAHTKNSFIGPVTEKIVELRVNVVQPICESLAENVVEPLLTNVVEPFKTNVFEPLVAHLSARHERAKQNGWIIAAHVAKRHERAVKNAKAIGRNAKALGKAMSEVMVWSMKGREVMNPPKTEKSVQVKEEKKTQGAVVAEVSKWSKVSQAASAKLAKSKGRTRGEKVSASGMSKRQRKVKKGKTGTGGRVRRVRT